MRSDKTHWIFSGLQITDQLFGGTGVVTGGAPTTLIENALNLFTDVVAIGQTQWANESCKQCITESWTDQCALDCVTDVGGMFPDHFCNADQSDHPMSYTQHVQFNIYDAKKTFANIYDGPFYVKGLRGMYQPNIPKSPGFSYGDCYATAFSAILSPGSSTGAFPVVTEVEYTDNPDSYTVQMPHAIIGWKQSNGFTYPANFLFNETAFHNVGYRHGVVDDLSPYSSGADTVPAQGTTSGVYGPQTAFDYQTIIYDLDGTLTGVVPSGGGKTVTNAISSNTFLSERGQMPECQAIGSQTSASEHINLFVWSLNTFGLPIFRQWTVDDDAYGHGNGDVSAASCGQPCTADHDRGCPRGMYMAGPKSLDPNYGPFQTTLLSHVGRYFIDLASGLQNADSSVAESYPEQCLLRSPADYQNRLGATAFFNCSGTTCFAVPDEQVGSRTFSMSVNYGRIDTNLTLIMYVGKNDKPQVTFGRKSFHGHAASEPHYDCDSCWAYNSSTGILTVRFDYSVLDPLEFAVRNTEDCLPSSLCKVSQGRCVKNTSGALLNHSATASRLLSADTFCYFATAIGGQYREEPEKGSIEVMVELSWQSFTHLKDATATNTFEDVAPPAEPDYTPNPGGLEVIDVDQCSASGSRPAPPSPPAPPPAPPAPPAPPPSPPPPPSSPAVLKCTDIRISQGACDVEGNTCAGDQSPEEFGGCCYTSNGYCSAVSPGQNGEDCHIYGGQQFCAYP